MNIYEEDEIEVIELTPEVPEKKANHQVNIVQIDAILPHNNADTLEIIMVGGYQCVVKKGAFHVGDFGVYIQPDSVVPVTEPFRFIWNDYQTADGTVPERRRRITVRKFRKEFSEGLLLPLTDFPDYFYTSGPDQAPDLFWAYKENGQPVDPGDDVSDMLGVTHYQPEEKGEGSYKYAPKKKRRMPRTFKGWINYIFRFWWIGDLKRKMRGESTEVGVNAPTYDVEALKNHMNAFVDGELVDVTEKIHGSNARYMFLDDHMYVGSRNLWKAPESKCIWRNVLNFEPWIERWCKAHPGYALYGEVTPTQKGFDYGSAEPQFFAFDIYRPDGTWVKPWDFNEIPSEAADAPEFQGINKTVPYLGRMPFDLVTIKANFVDGQTETDGKHVREGVVINAVDPTRTARGVGRLQLKIVSNQFYERDSKNESLV